jgi:anti-sigma factor RsiW
MSEAPDRCIDLVELTDYWTSDLAPAERDRIEAHVFTCAGCAARLADAEALVRGIATVVRAGRFHAVVTERTLNRLSRDGVRMRSFSAEPGESVHCAVWDGDDLIVARLRADLRGVRAATLSIGLANGEPLGELADVPVTDTATEVVMALSADIVREMPQATLTMRLTTADASAGGRVLGEYVFDHQGAFRSRDA